ncbi:MAG: zinc ribbon domain-containing protein [Chthoniobacterales bacterium]
MSEVVAAPKHNCPACGAQAQWEPATQTLRCPFCGTVSQFEETVTGEIKENDLATALRNIPESQRGWAPEQITVKCQSCQAISVFSAGRVAQKCDFCGSPALVPYTEIQAPIRPESLLAFKIAETAVRETIRKWYGSHWFAPNKLKNRALTDTLHGAYLPYWTFDAQAHAEWTAEAGYHYYETESYEDANGKTQTRQVQRTRWEYAAGSVDHFFDDTLVAASKGVPIDLLTKVEPFPTTELVPYNTAFLSGWVVEQYQIDLIAAAERSRVLMDNALETMCSREVPGDTQRNLQVDADYSAQTFKHILVPVWLLTYTYGSKNFTVVINGFTGQIAGKYPLSWIKIILVTLAVLIVIGIIIAANQR